MRNSDGSLTVMGRLVFVGMGVIVLNVVSLAVLVSTSYLGWRQAQDNERHIDCIVASAMTPPPERCEDIIAQLREDGILRPPPVLTTTP